MKPAPDSFGKLVTKSSKLQLWVAVTSILILFVIFTACMKILQPFVGQENVTTLSFGLMLILFPTFAYLLGELKKSPKYGEQFLVYENGFTKINSEGTTQISFFDIREFSHRTTFWAHQFSINTRHSYVVESIHTWRGSDKILRPIFERLEGASTKLSSACH